MYLKKSLVVCILGMTVLAATACSNVNKKTESINMEANTNVEATVDASDKIATWDVMIDTEKIDISDIQNGRVFQEIKYTFITCKANDTLKKEIDVLNKDSKEKAEKFKKDNKQGIRDFINEMKDENASYAYDSDISVAYKNNEYLSLVDNTYIFTMGAHGTSVINGHTYDIKTGKKLALDDFVKDKTELKEFLKSWVKNSEDDIFYPEAGDTIDAYFNGEYDLQFVLYNGEFHVIFQQYDIAPYAAGIIEINIDKNLLKVELN